MHCIGQPSDAFHTSVTSHLHAFRADLAAARVQPISHSCAIFLLSGPAIVSAAAQSKSPQSACVQGYSALRVAPVSRGRTRQVEDLAVFEQNSQTAGQHCHLCSFRASVLEPRTPHVTLLGKRSLRRKRAQPPLGFRPSARPPLAHHGVHGQRIRARGYSADHRARTDRTNLGQTH